jgi:hypothetical protein
LLLLESNIWDVVCGCCMEYDANDAIVDIDDIPIDDYGTMNSMINYNAYNACNIYIQ